MHYTELIEEIATTYGQDITEEINKNEEIIKELSANSYCPGTTIKRPTTVKCSVFVLAALKQKLDSDVAVLLGNALMHVFHLQTDIQSFRQIVKKHKQNIPKDVYKYIMQGRDLSLSMDENINDAMRNSLMLANAVFKLVHLNQPITEDLFSKIRNDKNCLSLIYCNPNILNKYLENENIQKFIFNLTEHLKSDAQNDVKIASYLKMLQRKLRSWMMQTIKQKQDTNIQDHIKLLNVIGLSTADLESILHQLVELPSSQYLNDEQKPNVMYNIATAILNNAYGMLCKENISTKPFEYIIHFVEIIIDLNLKKVDTSELAEAVYNYFARFPHQVASLKEELRTLFVSVACRYEYCKSNTKLAMHIYKYSNGYYLDEVTTHLKDICAKKGFILPLLDVLRHDENFTQSLTQTMFQEVLPLIAKTLQKPQKAGPHFEKHYEGICHLMQQCMPLGEMQKYLEKPVKFDANHVFIVAMCNAMYKSYFIGKNKKRLPFSVSSLFTHINFMVSHLKGLKAENENNDERIETLKKVVKYFVEFLQLVEVFWRKKAMPKANDVRSNDTFQAYYKLTLRHGVDSKKSFLMKPLSILSKYVCFTSKEAEEIVEMIFTHSEFLQIASEIPNDTKKDIFELLQTLCKAQSTVMKPYHVPILLAAYQATLHPSDRILLKLLKLYEENATSTAFYDYKPFFWGGVAANVYSIQTSSSHQVIRRGRPSDVLDSLQENLINATIMNFPQNLKLSHINISPIKRNPQEVYDLCFMLPLLSQILAPENQIVTYKFTRSGALALVIMGLSSHEREMRLASCHVLARFHYHLEAVRKSKDHVIWVQFVEAIARGMAALKDFRLHSFAAVFLARTALILANPQLPMFIPLSNYVAIKNKPNFSVIPELHTFLRSGDINHSMYKQFILEVLADGMRTEGDANILIDNYGFKLIMEMFNSAISTDAERILILNVIERATQLPNTTKRLCNGLALISWLYDILQSSMHYDILALLMKIYANLVQTSGDKRMVKIAYNYVIDNYFDVYFDQDTKLIILKAILLLQTEDKSFLTRERIKKIVNFSGCVKSEYILRFNVQMKVDSVKPEDSIELTTQNLMQICLN